MKMTAENILEEIRYCPEHDHFEFDGRLIEEISNFLDQEEIASINSALLVAGGHRPETKGVFKFQHLQSWAASHDLEVIFDPKRYTYLFIKTK
ncbi:MAG: hypothetical protein AAF717_00265 [Bacteroidota bacterium]